jgi:uncharacterized protein YidB (DUF937 family)
VAKNDKLLKAWDQLVKTLAQKEGFDKEEAVRHVRKHFPELYERYQEARKKKVGVPN